MKREQERESKGEARAKEKGQEAIKLSIVSSRRMGFVPNSDGRSGELMSGGGGGLVEGELDDAVDNLRMPSKRASELAR